MALIKENNWKLIKVQFWIKKKQWTTISPIVTMETTALANINSKNRKEIGSLDFWLGSGSANNVASLNWSVRSQSIRSPASTKQMSKIKSLQLKKEHTPFHWNYDNINMDSGKTD